MSKEYMWNIPILLGNEAKEMCEDLLDKKGIIVIDQDCSTGMWYENGKWIAYDNSTGDCWLEEFTDIRDAYLWATGQK